MKPFNVLGILAVGGMLWFGHVYAQPANDECSNAIPVDLYATYYGTTVGATGTGHSGCVLNDSADVWHAFLPLLSGEYSISLCGSNFDTTLAVYDACGGTELACNDDFCGVSFRQSEVRVILNTGSYCYIRVAGYGGQTGDYALTVRPLDSFSYSSPEYGSVVGGFVPVMGTIFSQLCFGYYKVDYRPLGGAWLPVDSAFPVYDQWVINGPLANWNTGTLSDGQYEVALRAFQGCSQASEMIISLTVDNTPPIAVIASPVLNGYLEGWVDITGTAVDANLEMWALQYAGPSVSGWTTLASGTQWVNNGTFTQWNTDSLPSGSYMLRLIVQDAAVVDGDSGQHHRIEYLRAVTRDFSADLDGDSDVDLHDFSMFAEQWLMGT